MYKPVRLQKTCASGGRVSRSQLWLAAFSCCGVGRSSREAVEQLVSEALAVSRERLAAAGVRRIVVAAILTAANSSASVRTRALVWALLLTVSGALAVHTRASGRWRAANCGSCSDGSEFERKRSRASC